MNFWTGLILGVIIGWLVEWIIDWLFWRRDAREAGDAELQLQERLAAAEALAAPDVDYEARLAEAEQEYQTRLRAVEEEWQARLNLNEQQWQSQFTAIEEENSDLRSRLSGAALGATGAALIFDSDTDPEDEAPYLAAEDSILADEMVIAELSEEDVAFAGSPGPDDWTVGSRTLDETAG